MCVTKEVLYLTSAVIIHHSGCFPLEELYQIQDGVAEGGVVRIQVGIKCVSVVHGVMFPPHLDVWNLQCIADGLYCI